MGLKGLSIVNQKIKWANNANNLAEQVDVQHATSNLVVNKYLLGVVKKLTPLLCINLKLCILNYPSEPRGRT